MFLYVMNGLIFFAFDAGPLEVILFATIVTSLPLCWACPTMGVATTTINTELTWLLRSFWVVLCRACRSTGIVSGSGLRSFSVVVVGVFWLHCMDGLALHSSGLCVSHLKCAPDVNDLCESLVRFPKSSTA